MNRDITHLITDQKTQAVTPAAIFEHYAPELYKYAFRLNPSAMLADQIVGDILARFMQHLTVGRYPGINLRLDLYSIAYDILARDLRYRNNFVQVKTRILNRADPLSTGRDLEDTQLLEGLQRAVLHNLTDDQRHVLMLRLVEGFSLKETALIMGKKVGAVKVIQNRGIAALRKALDCRAMETQRIALFIRQMSYA